MKRIFRSEGIPPFAHHAQNLMVQALDPDGTSSQLTRIITKDLGLTSQILRVANSSMYNRSGRPIMSVAHAITLLGWDTIRNLVSAVRFVEHYARRSPGLRELMMFALMSATHSRQVAFSVGHPKPEEAYLCALFRNVGEVLVARHYPEEYTQILLAVADEAIPMRAACIRVLDFNWDELGSRLSDSWNMPSKIRATIQNLAVAGSLEERSLASIANYGFELTQALYRHGEGIEAIHLSTVLEPAGKHRLVTVRDLTRIVNAAVEDTDQTFAVLHIPLNSMRLTQQAERAREILEALTPTGSIQPGQLGEVIATAETRLSLGQFEVADFIQDMLKAVLEAGFERAIFALMSEDRAWVKARLGAGSNVDEAIRQFQFPMYRADAPVLAAMTQHQDLLVDRARDARYDASMLVARLRPTGFALLPIIIDGRIGACVYADRRQGGTQTRQREPMSKIRDLIAAAIKQKAPHPATP